MSVSASLPARKGFDAWRVYFRPRIATMLLLGFASGLPFLLTGNTLSYWLRDSGTSLTAIGFLSWVGIAYSLKPLWAPLIDRVDAPIFGRRLGRRRGWMFTAQIIVCLGLLAMSLIGPGGGLPALGACALVVAFASSTQDIVVDAWRIEVAEDGNELGLLSSAYQLGYRAALLVTDALILIGANHLGWPISYSLMAALMGVGFFATWKATEPVRADSVMAAHAAALPLLTLRGFGDAVIGPFIAFFRAHRLLGLLMLAVISLYQIPNFVSGPMTNTFYYDLGVSKDAVGGIRASVGLIFSLLGIAAGGISAARFGYLKTLVAGILLESVAVAVFVPLAYSGGDLKIFAAVMAVDSFGLSFAGVALVTYMSSLTSLGYTATQYALLSATYAWLGKILKGFSGQIVDTLALGRNLMDAYALFFAGAAAIGLPALILCLVLAQVKKPGLSGASEKN
jgi:MFS transporter, PAT family, beta-lactamase induction signal transducer AmpG